MRTTNLVSVDVNFLPRHNTQIDFIIRLDEQASKIPLKLQKVNIAAVFRRQNRSGAIDRMDRSCTRCIPLKHFDRLCQLMRSTQNIPIDYDRLSCNIGSEAMRNRSEHVFRPISRGLLHFSIAIEPLGRHSNERIQLDLTGALRTPEAGSPKPRWLHYAILVQIPILYRKLTLSLWYSYESFSLFKTIYNTKQSFFKLCPILHRQIHRVGTEITLQVCAVLVVVYALLSNVSLSLSLP